MPMYGHRARIGYTSPPSATEVFPYELYKLVPDGVTVVQPIQAIIWQALRRSGVDDAIEGYGRLLRDF